MHKLALQFRQFLELRAASRAVGKMAVQSGRAQTRLRAAFRRKARLL
jgi:hypothetical protein